MLRFEGDEEEVEEELLAGERHLREDPPRRPDLRGDRTVEPQYLEGALKRCVEKRPNSLFGAEMIHVWTPGIAPCTEEKFQENFRLNSCFVGSRSRGAINRGTPTTPRSSYRGP
ncbi:MAG: hypothetical protein WCY97_09395 [Methanothrix sp.]|nr:MAG: hypothetical protein APR56_10940 [Methanosaeta sp. SDB]MCP1393503.1 hypothetical protein [Methanothrix harundinacea]MDD2638258.1 hypothetical protein [Methanothrix sp.]MDI9399170.1 hypothetical protein [Euryarchaeota archaeon]MDD3710796.1 hypothetical protein [Methanothrix sp.]